MINDWLYVFRVCWKYKIMWNPFFTLKYAQCKVDLDTGKASIHVNPFYKNFLPSALHEAGHIVRWRRLAKKCYTWDEFDKKIACILKEGAIAVGEMLVKEETDAYYEIEQWEVLE